MAHVQNHHNRHAANVPELSSRVAVDIAVGQTFLSANGGRKGRQECLPHISGATAALFVAAAQGRRTRAETVRGARRMSSAGETFFFDPRRRRVRPREKLPRYLAAQRALAVG
jgi:hypothetical protein